MDIINEIVRQQVEHTERTLAEIIENYDFMVGSMECKHKLMEILPEGAAIAYSPYIEDLTTIYAIKKFDITDLLEPYTAESDDKDADSKTCDDYDVSYCEQRDCAECEYNPGNN